MWTEFMYSLKKMFGSVMGWGLGFALLGLYLVPFYKSFAKPEQMNILNQLLNAMPKELMVFFGDTGSMSTPLGFLSIEYYSYIPVILGIFAISAGSGLLSRDEEKGILDITLSLPIQRWQFFLARFIAFVVALGMILVLSWLGLAIPSISGSFPLHARQLALPFFSLGAVLLVFGSMALMFSQILPSASMAAWISGAYMVASYFITSLVRLDDNLEFFNTFSILKYYQSGDALNGLKFSWIFGLSFLAMLMVIIGLWRFIQRDIRVGGEGSLSKPAWLTLDFFLGR